MAAGSESAALCGVISTRGCVQGRASSRARSGTRPAWRSPGCHRRDAARMSASTWSPPRPALMRCAPGRNRSAALRREARPAWCQYDAAACRPSAEEGRRGCPCGRGIGARRASPAKTSTPSAPRSTGPAPCGSSRRRRSRSCASLRAASWPSTPIPMMPTRTSARGGLVTVVLPEASRTCWRHSASAAAGSCRQCRMTYSLIRLVRSGSTTRRIGTSGRRSSPIR